MKPPNEEPRLTIGVVDGAEKSQLQPRDTTGTTRKPNLKSGPVDDIFGEARDKISIDQAWVMLALPGEPKKSCRSPFREERTASFTIFDNGTKWKDHGGDCGGDVIEFVKVATGKDYPEVREWFREVLGKPLPLPQPITKAPATKAGIKWPAELLKGKVATWHAFALNRNLTATAVSLMVEVGVLRFLAIDGVKCFAIMDSTQRAAEIRRIDRKPFGNTKAFPLSGVDKTWLPGAELLRGASPDVSVLMVEGATDFLTALDLYIRFRREVTRNKRWVVVTLLGAGCKTLDPDCAKLIRGRHVRIVPDADDAGDKMLAHWSPFFRGIECTVDAFTQPRGTDLTDNADKINPATLFQP